MCVLQQYRTTSHRLVSTPCGHASRMTTLPSIHAYASRMSCAACIRFAFRQVMRTLRIDAAAAIYMRRHRDSDRHCTVTVAITTIGGHGNPRQTRVTAQPVLAICTVRHVARARDAARPRLTDRDKRQTLAAAWFTLRTITTTCARRTPLEPWVIGSSRFAVPTGTERDAICVQHRRASQALHKQDWCVLRSIKSPCSLRRTEGAETLTEFSHHGRTAVRMQ